MSRAKVVSRGSAFNALVAAAASAAALVRAAVAALEPVCFSTALPALDGHFVPRLRGVEGQDGNPLNGQATGRRQSAGRPPDPCIEPPAGRQDA
jgi:hypothetical protein